MDSKNLGPSLVDWMLSDPPSQKVKHTEEHLIKMSQRHEQITDADTQILSVPLMVSLPPLS